MNNTKHTPGPWEAVAIAAKPGQITVQAVSEGRGALIIMHDGSEEGEANERLAIASPELLDAGRAFARAYEACNTILAPMEREAFDALLAAIAKATGQE